MATSPAAAITPGLAHGPAQPLPLDHGGRHKVCRTGQHRSDRGAQALRQAAGDGGGHRSSLAAATAAGHGGMPQAGLRRGARARPWRRAATSPTASRRAGSHTAPPAAIWVSSRAIGRDLGLVVGAPRDRLPRSAAASKLPISSGTVEPGHPGIARARRRPRRAHVLPGPGHYGVARPGQHAQGDLVGHGPGRNEQRRLVAGQVGKRLLQEIDGRDPRRTDRHPPPPRPWPGASRESGG